MSSDTAVEGKYDKAVMGLEFKKHNGKDSNKKSKQLSNVDSDPNSPKCNSFAKPVSGKGKVTKEQMLTAPHSPYFEVRVGQAVFIRQAANDEFAAGETAEAIKLYERALYHCDFSSSRIGFEQTEEQKTSLRDATDPIYLNLARCYLKQKEFNKAITNARASVHKDSTELNLTKSRFLEGKALCALKEYDKALEVLEAGARGINEETARRENTNLLQQSVLQRDYQELLKRVREGRARHHAHDVRVWRGLLGGSSGPSSCKDTTRAGELQTSVFSAARAPLLAAAVIILIAAIYCGQ